MRHPKVFIGVGHGGKDVGATGCNGVERDINLIIATELKRILNERGVKAKRSRKSNKVQDTVQQEVQECNAYKPTIAVEIHMNASASHKAEGFECYVISTEARILATEIKDCIDSIDIVNRGVKNGGGLYFLRNTSAPAVLLEGAFVDNNADKKWCTKAGAKKLARKYADGICRFLKSQGYKLNYKGGTI